MLIGDWRIDYNQNRPRAAHGDLTPGERAMAWATGRITNHKHVERICINAPMRFISVSGGDPCHYG